MRSLLSVEKPMKKRFSCSFVRQPRNEFIGDGGNGVVAAKPLV
jgi:hypothetical protein